MKYSRNTRLMTMDWAERICRIVTTTHAMHPSRILLHKVRFAGMCLAARDSRLVVALVRSEGLANVFVCSNCRTTSTPLWRRSPEGETICNACGLYLKARNTARPTNLKRPHASPFLFGGQEMDSQEGQENDTSPTADASQQAQYVPGGDTAKGSCPGGGHCNGTGGADGCSGCPAYNNRVSKTTWTPTAQSSRTQDPELQTDSNGPQPIADESPRPSISQESPANAQAQASLTLSCQNCGTTITPLWRRDESGRTICNACGKFEAH